VCHLRNKPAPFKFFKNSHKEILLSIFPIKNPPAKTPEDENNFPWYHLNLSEKFSFSDLIERFNGRNRTALLKKFQAASSGMYSQAQNHLFTPAKGSLKILKHLLLVPITAFKILNIIPYKKQKVNHFSSTIVTPSSPSP
jgi:hypothetical protein